MYVDFGYAAIVAVGIGIFSISDLTAHHQHIAFLHRKCGVPSTGDDVVPPVSYTHLTLPTSDLV